MGDGYSFDALKRDVAAGQIDTVVAMQVDMQGRLMGKRLHAGYFVDGGHRELHSCNYLLATDFAMNTVPGYAAAGWGRGYGDYVMRPDLATLRRAPWLPGSALVICDIVDPVKDGPVAHSPRAMLQTQIARLAAMGLEPVMASELEFYLFDQDFTAARKSRYMGLSGSGASNQDYHLVQTAREEGVMRSLRNGLAGADIRVEATKGEAAVGQSEINVGYCDAQRSADQHCIIKHALKEIAWSQGKSVTFLAKWNTDSAGSSAHIHHSLRKIADGTWAFHDAAGDGAMSPLMRSYLAGMLRYTSEITYFLAPYINSYKRFRASSFAPARTRWGFDNRTAAYRVCGAGTSSVRIECRIGGADLNPYLAFAALIAAGCAGIEQQLELPPAHAGNAYDDGRAPMLPPTLRDAVAALERSPMLRSAFSDAVIDHYVRAGQWEQEQFDRCVTDWEIDRGFEQA